jgi:hypothetical protein
MKRCHSPRDVRFQHYGGRGIKVCVCWRRSFAVEDALAEKRERQMDTIEDIAVLGALLVFSSLSLAVIVLMY